jgi:hypothetical protein
MTRLVLRKGVTSLMTLRMFMQGGGMKTRETRLMIRSGMAILSRPW